MPQQPDVPTVQHCIARALYDNIPDSPDELAFHKGDTLIVLEQNTANIEGWWLCSLRGRQGICPANRLRLIPGVYGDSQTGRVCSPQFAEIPNDHLGCLQREGKRRSWHVQPNQVITPKKYNDVYLYDMPPTRCSPIPVTTMHNATPPPPTSNDCYDVPPRAVPLAASTCPRCSPADAYDVPRAHPQPHGQPPLTPSSSASSLTADSSSNRSSLATVPDYDVPRSALRGGMQHYDIPPMTTPVTVNMKELPLSLASASENLERLQNDTTASISKLLGYVGARWRSKERLENTLMDIKLAVTRLKSSLHDLAEFGEGSLGNAARASDKNLAGKLAPLVAALKRSDVLVHEAVERLDEHRWSIDILAHDDDDAQHRKPDELEQLIACARALTEDIRQIASFIHGNGSLLFKRDIIDSHTDYDYVSLDSKENVARNHTEIRDCLPGKLQKGYDDLVQHADDIAFEPEHKSADDRQLLLFFAEQLIIHHKNLTEAIDAFLQTVEHNQPPKIFLAHGKFVVLSAHKLVHIGDTVHRNVACKDIKERALNCANALSNALATSVAKTKQAALQFPSVTAVQEMVDSIVDISYSAKDLKVCLVQAAAALY